MHMEKAATNKDCGSFFFVYRPSETRSHPAFSQSPLTAKLTAKPVDNHGFSWMGVDIRLACGAAGRHRWTAKDEKCRRGDSARFLFVHRIDWLYSLLHGHRHASFLPVDSKTFYVLSYPCKASLSLLTASSEARGYR